MNTIVNDEIRSEAQNRFLFEIDEILQEIPTCKHSDVPKKMIELSEAILSYLDQPITEDSLMSVNHRFDKKGIFGKVKALKPTQTKEAPTNDTAIRAKS